MTCCRRKHIQQFIKDNAFTFITILCVIAGIALGFILREVQHEAWKPREVMYIQFPGEIFLRMLKSIILPLIMASLISAIGSLDLKQSGRIGILSTTYYMVTTIMAITQGIIIVIVIHPGNADYGTNTIKGSSSRNVTTADTLLDLIRNMFPPNLVQAAISQHRTILESPKPDSNGTLPPIQEWPLHGVFTEGTNIMGLVVFSIALGIAVVKMDKVDNPIMSLSSCISSSMMVITSWVIHFSPIGILFLITGKLLEMESFEVIISQVGMYFVTVLIGLFCHGLIVLPIIYFILTHQLPFTFIANMSQALVTAFATSSSSATLPIAIACLENHNNIDPRISRFVMPIGATVNMDGTALYEAVAAIFISQVKNIKLSVGSIIAISITATAASIGAAGIPQAGLVTMIMVLDTVGLPAEDISLIISVDWLLDRFRTTVNVLGDSLGAGIVYHLTKKDLLVVEESAESQTVNQPSTEDVEHP